MILGEVLQLDMATGKAPGPVGTIKLEHTVRPAVLAAGHLHGLVFLHGRFRQLLPQEQYRPQWLGGRFQKFLHLLLTEGLRFHSLLRQPGAHLHHRVWILQPCLLFQSSHQMVPRYCIHGHGLPH